MKHCLFVIGLNLLRMTLIQTNTDTWSSLSVSEMSTCNLTVKLHMVISSENSLDMAITRFMNGLWWRMWMAFWGLLSLGLSTVSWLRTLSRCGDQRWSVDVWCLSTALAIFYIIFLHSTCFITRQGGRGSCWWWCVVSCTRRKERV